MSKMDHFRVLKRFIQQNPEIQAKHSICLMN
ncbi:hypothetical protein E2C01_031649 [Portunus trituberculatus]|uniref:Uncharacterized protein n=1 Tax=Portunus trituberculatus TaxID=210409 RepID=A0A5B7EXF6_PORTR|nr:hypothetical protein [Portunus trituberculatus]